MTLFFSVVSIYIFILIGFIAKKIFKEQIEEKTLVIISIYFLQPFLTFWGLTRQSIDYNLLYTPFLYLVVIAISLLFLILISKAIFKDSSDKSIFIATSLIGNTGNLAIPLGIALIGESSVAYTSIINIANLFFIYSVGIYFFAKSSYSLRNSLKEMLKIPILYIAIIALLYNILELPINKQFNNILEMGAYSAIVLQLIIFGVYLAKTVIKSHNYKLSFLVSFAKLIFVPFIGLIVINISSLPTDLGYILMLSLIVPLAINNVNMAALYNCKPYDVTAIVLISTALFLLLVYFDLILIEYFIQ